MVKQRFGGAVAAEVLEESVNEATQQVLTDRGLRAAEPAEGRAGQPPTRRKDLEFKVELELLPEIAMPDFAAIELDPPEGRAGRGAVDKALADIASASASWWRSRKLARRPAQGDVLTVDFIGKVDGVAFPGGTGTDIDVEVGGGGFIPGLHRAARGHAPGESRTIEVTFPEDYGDAELAGKPATSTSPPRS